MSDVLLLSDDLIFTSRVTGAGAAEGISIRVAKSPAALMALARQATPRLAIVDLANPGLVIDSLVGELRSLGVGNIVAYGPHVDAAGLKAARAAGCGRVMPRSQFAAELPARLREWLEGPTGG